MSPERWSQVKALLERVLARPAHEREEFLRHSCLGDSELYDEVTYLVEAHAADPKFREKHPDTAPLEGQQDPRIGATVKGRYRIKSRLGSGGVGVVYLAEDLHLMSRLVVVKFLHEQGRSQPGRLVKFLLEGLVFLHFKAGAEQKVLKGVAAEDAMDNQAEFVPLEINPVVAHSKPMQCASSALQFSELI